MRQTAKDHAPHRVDIHVGKQLRIARRLRNLSQEKLGDTIGKTFQQVQKYESGANRVSASILYELSRTLEMPTSYFFEGLDDQNVKDPDVFNKQAMILLHAYNAIEDEELRSRLISLTKAMSATVSETGHKPELVSTSHPRQPRSL